MQNTRFELSNPVADAINIVSGTLAAPLADALLEACGEDESIQGICHAVSAIQNKNWLNKYIYTIPFEFSNIPIRV